MRLRGVVGIALFTGAVAAAAEPPKITPVLPTCLAQSGNGVVSALITPLNGWTSVRLYFREKGEQDYYYLEMRAESGGHYWAVLPKSLCKTKEVEIYLAAKDAGGKITSTPVAKLDVKSDCQVTLTPEQYKYAQNLVVGETTPAQKGKRILGFCCEGVVSRIDSTGALLNDEFCVQELMTHPKMCYDCGGGGGGGFGVILPAAAIGAAAGGIVGVATNKPKECSVARP